MVSIILLFYALGIFHIVSFFRLVAVEFRTHLQIMSFKVNLKSVIILLTVFVFASFYMVNMLIVRSLQKIFNLILGEPDGWR